MSKQRSDQASGCSFILLSYNHSAYIEDALAGAFGQVDMGSYQVVVYDDTSVDGSKGVIERWIGAHRVAADVRFSTHNVGTTQALRQAASMSVGEYLIVAASDDISDLARGKAILEALEASPHTVYGGFSDVTSIGPNGAMLDPEDRPNFNDPNLSAESIAADFSGFLGASSFYHRDVFRRFGPLSAGILHEDMVLNFRAALLGHVIFLPKKLVRYRQHHANVHSFDRAGKVRARLVHALKIGRSLTKVAEQRCDDLMKAREWVSARRAESLWRCCVYWRSTHRIKVAILTSRLGWKRAMYIAVSGRVSFKEIAKASVLRLIARAQIWLCKAPDKDLATH